MASPLKVEFQFDFGSPNAYLAEFAIPGIEKRTGVKFEYVPVLLGGIYKATNNMSPFESLRGIKNKPEYQALETQRFIRRHNITKFKQNPFFPVNTLMLMRGAVAARFENMFDPYFRRLVLPSIARAGRPRPVPGHQAAPPAERADRLQPPSGWAPRAPARCRDGPDKKSGCS